MVNNITLTASMRSNLLSLKSVATQVDKTQLSLSTGKDVNSAIDNASSYYQARALTNRASDLEALLDNMGKAIQTIKAAIEGLTIATNLLEQAKAVAEQALQQTVNGSVGGIGGSEDTGGTGGIRPIEEFVAEGYTVVPAGAGASDIETLIASGNKKLVLSGDITISESINIGTSDVILEGNGNKIVYNSGSGGSAIVVEGSDSIAEISNLIIEANGSNVRGIQVLNGGSVIIDNPSNIRVRGTGSQIFQNGNDDVVNLYAGEANTQAIVNQLGADGLAATAANQFYVGSKTGDFGQGTWYLPSIGELMDMYGTDTSAITSGTGTSGTSSYNDSNMKTINDALSTLASKDASIAEQMSGYYWSSSEGNDDTSWRLKSDTGGRTSNSKGNKYRVRCFQLLENFFNPSRGDGVPKIGDVVYSDKSYGSAENYDRRKTAVGVICDVGEDGSVKIVNLKDLTFSSSDSIGNFNADFPYIGSTNNTAWATKIDDDVTAITNYDGTALLNAMKSTGSIVVADAASYAVRADSEVSLSDDFSEQYSKILSNYNDMVRDASYQGVNLLSNGRLSVTLNETRNHNLEVLGVDASYDAIGLKTTDWKTIADVEQSLGELVVAISKLRNYSESFGNQYQLIQTRQSFTDALISVLETGADDLVLADMNEESANYLALQTRQQLATYSLSLASQSAQNILGLF